MNFAFNILALVVLLVGVVILIWGLSDLLAGSLIIGIVLTIVGLIIIGRSAIGLRYYGGRGHIDP